MTRIFTLLVFLVSLELAGQIKQPLPSRQQLAWHDMEFYFFMHFGPNTFTDKEWGHGDEPDEIFNPSQLDCRQWVKVAKESGAKGIIITAKHHDGFCLWPSKYSKHTVRESKWKEGKGDVLKELSQACKEQGLKFGVYISPWDRNHPDYGTEKYNDVFVNMMKELFTNYGPIWELWWDGANGEGPNGKKQVYDWRRFENTVRQLSPTTVIFSDIGPDIRWVGNESGIAGKTNWNYLDTAGYKRGLGAPANDTLQQGNILGKNWIPAECDVSIRPGWFWHANEDTQVKSPERLFDLYLKSVGRGANLLLNVPPDNRGLIHENDVEALIGFKKIKDENFKNNLLKQAKPELLVHDFSSGAGEVTDDSVGTFRTLKKLNRNTTGHGMLFFTFIKKTRINCISIQEAIQNGQCIKGFEITFWNGGTVVDEIKGSTIGNKRIITFPAKEVTGVSILINDANCLPAISEMAAYLIDEKLIEQ